MTNTDDAKNMRNGIDIEGSIVDKGEVRSVNTKSGGTINVCDAYLEDDMGKIKLTLWAEDTEKIENGTKIKLKNAYTTTFKGEVALTKGKYGELTVL